MKAYVWIIFAALLFVFTYADTKSLRNNEFEKDRAKRSASSLTFVIEYEGRRKKVNCTLPCTSKAKARGCDIWRIRKFASKPKYWKCMLCQKAFRCGETETIF